jgi:hypothetical protein
MSRLISFCGGNPFDRSHRGQPYTINDRLVTRAEYRRRWILSFGDDRKGRRPLARGASIASRKRAIDGRRKFAGCHHEFSYHEDHEDYGCYGTRTSRWLECDGCGEHRPASWEDAPTYDEDY